MRNAKNLISRYKKGNAVLDCIVFLIIIFGLAFTFILGKYIINDINTDFQADPDFSNQSKQIISDQNTGWVNFFDYLFLFVFFLAWCMVLIASFNINSHPIFFVFTFIFLIFVFMIAGFMNNVYEEFTADAEISSIASSFSIANWIMTHLLLVAIIVGFSIVFVMFAKNRWEGG